MMKIFLAAFVLLLIPASAAYGQVETMTFPNGTSVPIPPFETMVFPNGTAILVPTLPESDSFPVQLDQIYEEAENVTIYYTDQDGIGVAQMHYPYFLTEQGEYVPYRLTQNDSMVQVEFSDGKMVFDKNAGAVTLFKNGNQVVDSDSYLVRTAQLDSDEWTFLDVNDSDVETIIEEKGDIVTITFRQQNNEGIFDVEHIFQGEIKTTAKFTNFIYPNHKFAFTQTLNLSDNIITLNDQEINLDDFVGQTFPREVLEQNEDLVLLAKDLHYNSGIGFENLWSVGIFENNKIALDYANVEEIQTAIGETLELDPTYQAPTSGSVVSASCTGGNNNNFSQATDNADYSIGNHNYAKGVTCGCSGGSPGSCQTFSKVVKFDLGATYEIASITTYHSGYGWWSGYHPTISGTVNGNQFMAYNYATWYDGANSGIVTTSGTVNDDARYITYTMGGNAAWKGIVEVKPYLNLATVSTAPQSLSIDTQDVANEITLNWLAPSSDGGASITAYKVYLGGSLIATTGNVLTYDDTISGGEIGSSLVYTVKAVNSVGDSVASTAASVTSWNVPSQVTGLSGTSGSSPSLSWSAPSSEASITNYKIYRGGSLHDTIGATTSYSDSTSIVSGTTYSYTVSAVSGVGEGSQSGSTSVVAGVPPDAPSLVLTHDSSNLNINVAITNGASMGTGTFTQWNIERSADGSTGWSSVGTATTTPFVDNTVPNIGDWYYRATTQSDHGVSAYSSIVNIAHVDPDAPSITAAYNNPANSDIEVGITNGASMGTGTFTNYSIERSADGSTNWTSVGTATSTPFTDNTVPSVGDWYYRAVTNTGHSTSAYSSNALASPIAPDAPTNLTSVISNPNPSPLTISLDWDSPINFGSGTLTGYEVYRDGSLITTTGTASQYDDTVSVQGTYVYTIKTVTTHSTSVLSGQTSISTPTQPTADSSVTLTINNPNPSPLDVTVSFVAPSSDNGSAVTGYNLSSSPDDITYTQIVTGVTADQTVTLANSGTWYFKSQAINNIGTAALGTAVSITTPSVPDAPATVNTSINNPNTNPFDITIGFTSSPDDQGSSITGYKVYRSSDNITYSLIATLGNSVLSYADTVTVSGGYYFKVSSLNNVGEGLQSAYSLINTPTVPDAPVLTSGAVSSSQIDSTWTTPSNGNSVIVSYEISVDGTVSNVGLVNADSQTGLTQNTAYEIKIRAVNNVGTSAWSNAITSTTNIPPSGTNTISLNNSWGDVVIVDNTITVTGNPTPTLDKIEFVLDTDIVSTVNNPSLTGTYAITLPDTVQHGLLVRVTASNGDTVYYDSNSITVTGTTVYRVDAAEGGNTVAYTTARTPHPTNDALDQIELKWAKDTFPFDGSCTFMSPSQALEVRDLNNLPSSLSFTDQNGVNIYDTTVNISEKNNAYVYCWSGDDLQFGAQSEALGSNALLAGLSGLDSGLGTTTVDPVTGAETSYSILGAPMIVIFVLLIAGQATGRTAPTFIIIILAAVGILMGLGFFIIDEGIFGLILIMGAMGVMIGKKFL